VTFRDRLVATIHAARPVLETPGVLVVGSEVPNLLEAGAAATLVVSQDLDVGVPVDRHANLKTRLGDLDEVEGAYRRLRTELRHVVRSNLTILSLLGPREGMPDPRSGREDVAALLRRLEAREPDLP
jgi:hypothetical protein